MVMVTDLKQLIDLCSSELVDREYGDGWQQELVQGWEQLSHWMDEQGLLEFSEKIGYKYCDEIFGGHLLRDDMAQSCRIGLRAVRMLISYQKTGDFEFRSPKVEHCFSGENGKPFIIYLSYARDVMKLAVATLSNKEFYLHAFYTYLEGRSLTLDDLGIAVIEEFYTAMGYTLASRHNCGSALRIFLRYAFDNGMTNKDWSIYLLSDNYKHYCKLPTTYDEAEISSMIAAVDRASPTGKRDYVILLLAAEYGWRSKDIVSLRFNQIDWDRNVINYNQSKTDTPVEYPLLASIGNAIIDYVKNGRPDAGSDTVVVAAESGKKGKPLSPSTVHSVVTRYMRKADIANWNKKKHGAHSLRHSLASNMLKKNISMQTISTVIGHQRTETTKIYLSIDVDKLRQCTLPVPELNSPYYRTEAI
jgi:site-specific recombinase XerD